ncbi:MAG: thioredoxin family protein [Acidobacteriota bacterium]|nr:thioredoxin family protein [Acidobacteriota bacterium]
MKNTYGTCTAAAASFLLAAAILLGRDASIAVAPAGSGGANALTLAPNLSFTDDSSSNFPIRGRDLADGRIASDRPTVIFFGTSHCWNTNREAERFVALYEKIRETARFLVVDLDHSSSDQKALVSRFYGGSIPTLAFLDAGGKVVYNEAGETSGRRGDTAKLEELLAKAKTGGR